MGASRTLRLVDKEEDEIRTFVIDVNNAQPSHAASPFGHTDWTIGYVDSFYKIKVSKGFRNHPSWRNNRRLASILNGRKRGQGTKTPNIMKKLRMPSLR
jgi:hypothetical protein